MGGDNEDRARLIGSTRPKTTITVNEVVVENDWKFGEAQEDKNEQGEKATTIWTMDGEKMVGKMTNDGGFDSEIVREIKNGKMVQVVKIGEHSASRKFEKM